MIAGSRTSLLVLAAMLFASREAHGEGIRAGKQRRARTACLAGDYAEGVRLLSELFVATRDPAFIYNQGRCFEQNRRYEDAIGRFHEYLRVATTDTAAMRDEAQKHIDECTKLLANEKAQSAPVAPSNPQSVTPAANTETVAISAAKKAEPASIRIHCNREGALVRLDGKETGQTPLPAPLPVTAGEHDLVGEYQGESISRRLVMTEGEAKSLELLFADKQQVPEVARSVVPAPSRTISERRWYRSPWVWAAAGVVVAGVATTLFLVYDRRDTYPETNMGIHPIGN